MKKRFFVLLFVFFLFPFFSYSKTQIVDETVMFKFVNHSDKKIRVQVKDKDDKILAVAIVNSGKNNFELAQVPQFGKGIWKYEIAKFKVGTYRIVISERMETKPGQTDAEKWKVLLDENFDVIQKILDLKYNMIIFEVEE